MYMIMEQKLLHQNFKVTSTKKLFCHKVALDL